MANKECDFCDPSGFVERTISSNEHAVSVLSAPRLTPGHSLVIPRRHIESFHKIEPEEMLGIKELIDPIYERLLGAVALGVDIWQKTRPYVEEGPVKRNHLHFHILPSNPGDERYTEALRWSRGEFDILSAEEREEMLGILKP